MPRGSWGAVPGGGWPATVMRGVWCQALSLPWPPVLWSGELGFRDPCVPGAVGAGVGTQHPPTACAFAGWRCSLWGWRKGVPGGGAFHHCEGRLRSGAIPHLTVRPRAGLLGSVTHVLWARVLSAGAQHCPLGLHALWGLRAAGVVGGRPRGGWPATVVRGVWCQALSLPWPPVLWSGQPGFRDPCVPGAVGAGVGTQHPPTACALAGWLCSLWGWREGVPGGGAFHHCEGRLRSGAVPPPTARPLGGLLGSATHVLRARVLSVGAQHCPLGLHALWGLRAAGVVGGRPRGGWPATVVRGVWCQALSLPRPPVLWSGQSGFRDPCVPGPVGAGVGTQHWPHSVRRREPALLAVGLAEGRPRGGCLPPL